MKYLYLVTFLLMAAVLPAKAGNGYPSTPAIVQIPKSGQHDTVGFNIVKELPSILYGRILTGEINLYLNPLKDSIRSPQDFIDMENRTRTYLKLTEDIFLDEDWSMKGKKFTFEIRGIYCLNRSSDGVQVNYGYIDLEEIKGLLKSLIISTNSNGPKNLTFWDALYSRRYAFNLVKFGSENLTADPARSFEIKNEAFFDPKVTTNALQLNEVKEVESVVSRVDFNDDKKNSLLYDAVEAYFKQNPQEFFNLGGATFENHINPELSINLTRIELTETWRKTSDGISYQIDNVVFYMDDQPMKPLSAEELEKLGFLVNFQRLEDYLRDKSYFFTVTRVNNQKIYGNQAQDVLNALLTKAWNKILITSQKNDDN